MPEDKPADPPADPAPTDAATPAPPPATPKKEKKKKKKDGEKKEKKPKDPNKPKKKKKDRSKSPMPKEDKGPGCKFNEFGCHFKGSERKTHEGKEPVMHLSMLLDSTIDIKRELLLMSEEHLDAYRNLDKVWIGVERLRQIGTSAFVWRIDRWSTKYELAEGGHEVVIFSPSFYTARHGYRMMVSLCPFGDGKVRGQYMSVFVAIVRGQWDALLHWPFSYKVKIVLLDQDHNPQEKVNHAVVLNVGKPKKDNQFLMRPKGERNPSFGLQKFIDFPTYRSKKFTDPDGTDDLFVKIELTDEEHIGDLRYE